MRIVIDLQGCQAAGRLRGVGRYTVALAKHIINNRGDHEVLLAANGHFRDTLDDIRDCFYGCIDGSALKIWDCCRANGENEALDGLLYEYFIRSLEPDILLITGLFERDAVLSVRAYANTPVAAIFYDAIPCLYKDYYLADDEDYVRYARRLHMLKKADVVFAPSRCAAEDYRRCVDARPDRVVTLPPAADPDFTASAASLDEGTIRGICRRNAITKPFVLGIGGDRRKNAEGLLTAFSLLPPALRERYQLVIAGVSDPREKASLRRHAENWGLKEHETRLLGPMPDTDLQALYRACHLFVFPSLYEGFGLPLLEAMACGAPAISSSSSSLPEIMDCDEALFEAENPRSLVDKLLRALTDEAFRARLIRHGTRRMKTFSWDKTAQKALRALEETVAGRPQKRLKLAYVSPFLPEKSGISFYSAELVPELEKHYDVTCVVLDDKAALRENIRLSFRPVSWFEEHFRDFDRVLYHFGNSEFHIHMFDLLRRFPGVVVLHDFFLSGAHLAREAFAGIPAAFSRELFHAHGYDAIRTQYDHGTHEAMMRYPVSASVMEQSLGVISHSRYSRQLAETWYGEAYTRQWRVIPLLQRENARSANDRALRESLGIGKDTFVICSFGFLTSTKKNCDLIEGWLASELAGHKDMLLVFVGEHGDPNNKKRMEKLLSNRRDKERVRVTGWASEEDFETYMKVCDVAVQLRTSSRGETSAAILTALSYGIPTITNKNGSFAELPEGTVVMLEDDFQTKELAQALNGLWKDPAKRKNLGERGLSYIRERHSPAFCAAEYSKALEAFYETFRPLHECLPRLCETSSDCSEGQLRCLSRTLSRLFPQPRRQKRLFVDISALVVTDLRTGIQRVTRSILAEWLKTPPPGWIVCPVYANGESLGYRHAHAWMRDSFGYWNPFPQDDFIDYAEGDLFLGLDLHQYVVPAQLEALKSMHNAGVKIHFVLYDLLPMLFPQHFPQGMNDVHEEWLKIICNFDGVLCISRSVLQELRVWHEKREPRRRPLAADWFHIGCDIENSQPTRGLPPDGEATLKIVGKAPTVLMVSTIEPRKGYGQTLDAFELLWSQGQNVHLVVVGKRGWNVDPLIKRLAAHKERGKRLFWLEGISDEYLDRLYAAANVVLMASEGEGFGLAIVEGARHGKPLILRDIPVFREIAGKHAFYFRGDPPEELAKALREWFSLRAARRTPSSQGIKALTWKESADMLRERLAL